MEGKKKVIYTESTQGYFIKDGTNFLFIPLEEDVVKNNITYTHFSLQGLNLNTNKSHKLNGISTVPIDKIINKRIQYVLILELGFMSRINFLGLNIKCKYDEFTIPFIKSGIYPNTLKATNISQYAFKENFITADYQLLSVIKDLVDERKLVTITTSLY